MTSMNPCEEIACPACGGAGGGPFGRAGRGWDIETYECVRCEGAGRVLVADEEARARTKALKEIEKPGLVKGEPALRAPQRRASSDDK